LNYVQIEEKNKEFLKEYIKETLNIMKFTKNGHLPINTLFPLDVRKVIISSKISIQGADLAKEEIRLLIFKSLKNLKTKGTTSLFLEEFNKDLNSEIALYLSLPENEYCLIFPLYNNSDEISRKRKYKVREMEFKKKSWDEIKKFSGWKDFTKRVSQLINLPYNPDELMKIMINKFIPLIIFTKGRSADHAFQNAYIKYDLFCSILNLSDNLSARTYFFGGPPTHLEAIFPSPYYIVFKSGGDYETLYITYEKYKYDKKGQIKRKNLIFMEKIMNHLERKDEKLRFLIEDSILKYGQALNTLDWRYAFLDLWQILENLSLCRLENYFKMETVINRINALLGENNSSAAILLEELKDTRNKLVHDGEFSKEGLLTFNLLKIIVDRSLLKIFSSQKKFSNTNSLKLFFQHISQSDSNLKETKRIINMIQRSRSKL